MLLICNISSKVLVVHNFVKYSAEDYDMHTQLSLSTLVPSIFFSEKQDDEMYCKEYFPECLLMLVGILFRRTRININPWIIIMIDYNRVIIMW